MLYYKDTKLERKRRGIIKNKVNKYLIRAAKTLIASKPIVKH